MRSRDTPSRPHEGRRRLIRFVVASIIVVATASQSMADQEWSITTVAGMAKEQHRGRGWNDSSIAIGLAAGWTLSPALALEADFTYVPDMFPDAPAISAKLSVFNLTGTLLYDLTAGKWQPYLAVGAGFGRTRFTQPEFGPRFLNPPHWGPGISAGGGLKRRVTPRTELRADVRYILIRDISDDVTDLWRVAAGITVVLGR